jgi:hypothetical protein
VSKVERGGGARVSFNVTSKKEKERYEERESGRTGFKRRKRLNVKKRSRERVKRTSYGRKRNRTVSK